MEIRIEDLADFELTTPEVQALMKILQKIKKKLDIKPEENAHVVITNMKKPNLLERIFKKKKK